MVDDLEAESLDDLSAGDVQPTVKVLVIGNGHVGKSTFVTRFCRGQYNDTYKKTIGCEYSERRNFSLHSYRNKMVDVMVWDTAGQEEYRSLNHKYYSGAGCALILFSTTDENSFKELPHWKNKVIELCGDVPMAIVQTKTDAMEHAFAQQDDMAQGAQNLNLRLFRSSSQDGTNIEEPFEYVAVKCLRRGGGNSEQQVTHISDMNTGSNSGHNALESGAMVCEEKSNTMDEGGEARHAQGTEVQPKQHQPTVYTNRPTAPSRRRTTGKKDRARQKNIELRVEQQRELYQGM